MQFKQIDLLKNKITCSLKLNWLLIFNIKQLQYYRSRILNHLLKWKYFFQFLIFSAILVINTE